MFIEHLNYQVSALISNGQQIQQYHEDMKADPNESNNSSIGTIVSADERDLGLLFNGDHTYQFQTEQTVKSIAK